MHLSQQTEILKPRRFLVVGTSGSGKTTMARAIAAKLGIPHVEVDSLFHLENWKQEDPATFREKILARTAGDCWVVDGNYRIVQDLILPRVELIVWLDVPLYQILYRLLYRTISRIFSGEELWNGNKESWGGLFAPDNVVSWAMHRHSINRARYISWAMRRHGINPARYLRMASLPGFSHIKIVRLRTVEDAKRWIEALL